MKKKRISFIGILSTLSGFAFLILIWFIIANTLHASSNQILPYPDQVWNELIKILFLDGASNTYIALGWTIARLLIGWGISIILGAILGTLAGLFPIFEKFMLPFVELSRSVPTAAVVLILVGVFYQYRGLPAYIPCFLVFLVAFPIIYESFRSGIAEEPTETKDALALDAGRRNINSIVHVYWPDSMSYILLATVQSIGLSMKVSVMSEILVNSSELNGGIGGLIQDAKWNLDMKSVIAYSLVAVIMVLLADIGLALVKRRLKKQ